MYGYYVCIMLITAMVGALTWHGDMSGSAAGFMVFIILIGLSEAGTRDYNYRVETAKRFKKKVKEDAKYKN